MAEKGKSAAEVKRLVEVAGLKAKLAMATAQNQQAINLLAKYSEGLGRVMQLGQASVDRFAKVEAEHGPCPDEGLAVLMAEQRKVLYGMLPKEKANDAEEADTADKGEPERPADGGLDAVGPGEAPEGKAAPSGAPVEGEAAPDPDAPAPSAG